MDRVRKHTVSEDIDQSSLVRADSLRFLPLQDVGLVPGKLVDNIGIGHRVLVEEHEHALVVLG